MLFGNHHTDPNNHPAGIFQYQLVTGLQNDCNFLERLEILERHGDQPAAA